MLRRSPHSPQPTSLFVAFLALAAASCAPPPSEQGASAGSNLRSVEQAATRRCGPVDASGNPVRVRGIDVSYYQGTIDWEAVAATDIRFAVVRLSDGTGTRDSQFVRNWQEAGRVGLTRGFYQYFRASAGGAAQAALAVERLAEAGGTAPNDLPPTLDIETLDGQSVATVVAEAEAWVEAMRVATGKEPIIYTGAYFWDDNGFPDTFSTQPLWTANYTSNPCPWTSDRWANWTFWQYSDSGTVAGIEGAVDLDWFAGTLDDLQRFANSTIAPTCEPNCPTCVDRCAAADARTCIGDVTFTRCEVGADGCLGWGAPVRCPDATVCEAGDCNAAPISDAGTTDAAGDAATDTSADASTSDAGSTADSAEADAAAEPSTGDTDADASVACSAAQGNPASLLLPLAALLLRRRRRS